MRAARSSVWWAVLLIGSFYIMTTFLGFGAATIVGRDYIAGHGGNNMSAPLLAQALAGDIFFAFIAAIAFATILAVVAGLAATIDYAVIVQIAIHGAADRRTCNLRKVVAGTGDVAADRCRRRDQGEREGDGDAGEFV